MPGDMKETIAKAAMTLLSQNHVKKLTVKDIVEQCHITRQSFYYHFEDIPDLFRWMLEKRSAQVLEESMSREDTQEGLRCFLVMAVHISPYIKQGIGTGYQAELEGLLRRYIQQFFLMAAERKNLYAQCSISEVKIISRYHSLAILGLLQEWSEQDTDNLDQIVDVVYRLMTKGIPPQGQK